MCRGWNRRGSSSPSSRQAVARVCKTGIPGTAKRLTGSGNACALKHRPQWRDGPPRRPSPTLCPGPSDSGPGLSFSACPIPYRPQTLPERTTLSPLPRPPAMIQPARICFPLARSLHCGVNGGVDGPPCAARFFAGLQQSRGRVKGLALMEFRWAALMALWSMLSGPMFSSPIPPPVPVQRHLPTPSGAGTNVPRFDHGPTWPGRKQMLVSGRPLQAFLGKAFARGKKRSRRAIASAVCQCA